MEMGVREEIFPERMGRGGQGKDVIKCVNALGIMILCLKRNTGSCIADKRHDSISINVWCDGFACGSNLW